MRAYISVLVSIYGIEMHRKLGLYQDAGEREYWVVDTEHKLIEAYLLKNGHYEPYILRIDDTLRSALFPDLSIPVKTIFDQG